MGYVSRGGLKLEGALKHFRIPVAGRICLDVGSSTGGFTDCLLQAGAKSVWAVDVGYGLLDYNLRKDPRVHVLEKTNFRFIEPTRIAERPTLIVADVSFISLDKILPKIAECIAQDADVVVLVKPQFEGTPKEAPRGFVKDEATRQAILGRVKEMANKTGFVFKGVADAVIAGRKGNQETFFHLTKQ